MTDEQKNQPLGSSRDGSISLAIFDGTYGKNAVLQKSYLPKEVRDKLNGAKAKPEDWKRSQLNLFMNEIASVKKCVDEIYEKFKDEIEAQKKE